MSFYFIDVKIIEKYKYVKKRIHIWKNIQAQLMSFYYINVEIIRKYINVKKSKFERKYIQVQLMIFSYILEAIGNEWNRLIL